MISNSHAQANSTGGYTKINALFLNVNDFVCIPRGKTMQWLIKRKQ